MKRILTILLVAAMCLPLVACSNEAPPFITGNGETPGASNNNSGAQPGGENAGNNNSAQPSGENTGNNNTEESENPFLNHPHLAYIYGQWELRVKKTYEQGEEIPCSALTINDDGTCVVDGVLGTWDFSEDTRDNFLKINIFVEGAHRYCAAYYDHRKSIGVWSADYGGSIDTAWLNMSVTEAITLTLDNWSTYYEIVYELVIERNAFDEVSGAKVRSCLQLKPEYSGLYIAADDFAAEISYKTASLNAEINFEEETYEITQDLSAISTYAKHSTIVTNAEKAMFYTSGYTFDYQEFRQYPYTAEVTKVKGTLYLVKTDD